MAKKVEREEGSEKDWMHKCSWREYLYVAGAVFFGALGFALLLEGILGQINIGFRAGFVSYLFGFLFLGVAKHLKWCTLRKMGVCR